MFLPVGYNSEVGLGTEFLCIKFACVGYCEIMHGAILSTTGLTLPNLVPRRHGEERDQPAVYHLFSCGAHDQLAAHKGAGGETCMDVLVASADKPRP